MMSVLLFMIVAAIFAERRLAQLEGENLNVKHRIMRLYILVQHRSLPNIFFSDIPVYATDVEILQQMQMNVGLLSFSTRTLLR